MKTALWIYAAGDPTRTSDVRRLGLPALLLEGPDWRSRFVAASSPEVSNPADLVICSLEAADCLSQLAVGSAASIIIEVDTHWIDRPMTGLHALANRIAGVVARSGGAVRWAARALNDAETPIWLVRDPAARPAELAAVATRFGLPQRGSNKTPLPDRFELWFCESGDRIGEDEIEALLDWIPLRGERMVVAPPEMRAWLKQAGVRFIGFEWSPQLLREAIESAEATVFFGRTSFSQARRRTCVYRLGGRVRAAPAPSGAAHLPLEVGREWRKILEALAPKDAPPRVEGAILIFIDLVQDLDLALPLIDELQRRRKPIQIVVTTWLQRRSPRVDAELSARGVAFNLVTREAVLAGEAPQLSGTGALISPAESSHSAHQRAHVLFRRARALKIPTFSMQHGVENVGLTSTGTESDDPVLLSDHLFTWAPPGASMANVSPSLRPRLVPVGRIRPPLRDVEDLRNTLSSFRSIAAVFENLHWTRFDSAWRKQFLIDCVEFAAVDPTRCVLLKPHHGGLWSTRHTHLFPHWPQNLVLADPTDPFWEPFTAPSLVQMADFVITTPSTVALDAVEGGKPVAVAAYGIELEAYSPLTLLHSLQDWLTFASGNQSVAEAQRRSAFQMRTALGDHAEEKIADHIIAAMQERAAARAPTLRARA